MADYYNHSPKDLAARLAQRLQGWTGVRWGITLVNGCEESTIVEVRDGEKRALRQTAEAHPLVQAVMLQFPQAKITAIRTPEEIAAEAQVEALPEVEDEWDPFEED